MLIFIMLFLMVIGNVFMGRMVGRDSGFLV